MADLSSTGRGLSPRVRGSLPQGVGRATSDRSIPACAGEPRASRSSVHVEQGLSPRVRGSLRRTSTRRHPSGSIPACAGEPTLATHTSSLHRSIPACAGEPPWSRLRGLVSWVYPRVCGGARAIATANRSIRSIPACAGEPERNVLPGLEEQVYPRVCGGARV